MVNALAEAIPNSLPLSRFGETSDIAGWVLNLADPEVTWVTGQVISIDGGMSIA